MVLETLKSYKWNKNWKTSYSGIYKWSFFNHQIMTPWKLTNCHASYVTGGFLQPFQNNLCCSEPGSGHIQGYFWIHCSLSVAHLTSTDHLKVGVWVQSYSNRWHFQKAKSQILTNYQSTSLFWDTEITEPIISVQVRVEAIWATWSNLPK